MVCRAEAGSEERLAAADAEADFLDGIFMVWGAGRGSEVKMAVDSTGSSGEGLARESVEVGAFIVAGVGLALAGGGVVNGVWRAVRFSVLYFIG